MLGLNVVQVNFNIQCNEIVDALAMAKNKKEHELSKIDYKHTLHSILFTS